MVKQSYEAHSILFHGAAHGFIVGGESFQLFRIGHPYQAAIIRLGDPIQETVDLKPLLVKTQNVERNAPYLEHSNHITEVFIRIACSTARACLLIDAVTTWVVPLVTDYYKYPVRSRCSPAGLAANHTPRDYRRQQHERKQGYQSGLHSCFLEIHHPTCH